MNWEWFGFVQTRWNPNELTISERRIPRLHDNPLGLRLANYPGGMSDTNLTERD